MAQRAGTDNPPAPCLNTMNTVKVSYPSEILYMNCRACGEALPVGLRTGGYCEKHRAPGEIEYYFCLVCSDRLPVTRRMHGTHEECAPYYFPSPKKKKCSEVEARRKIITGMLDDGLPVKQIALLTGVSTYTIRNDIHAMKGAA